MTKKKIFISYDYDNDKNYKNMLLAWNKNKTFDFDFTDGSADVSIKSNDKSVIRRAISAKINQSGIFLCLIGQHTNESDWVKEEIEKAVELNKQIIAVKIEKDCTPPDEIKGVQAKWVIPFNLEDIKEAIEECTTFTIHSGVKEEPEVINPSKPWSNE